MNVFDLLGKVLMSMQPPPPLVSGSPDQLYDKQAPPGGCGYNNLPLEAGRKRVEK